MSNHNIIHLQQQQQQKQQQELLQKRQEKFDEFMAFFSAPEMFGSELFNLYSMDASEEAPRLLADCIEANWIIFGGGDDNSKQEMMMTSLKEMMMKKNKSSNSNNDDDEGISQD